MSRYRDQVVDALLAVGIHGPTRYAWQGRKSRPLPARLQAQMDDAERRAFLVASLREELYASFYCRGRAVPALWGEPQPIRADPRLRAELSAANTGHGAWENGWTVERVEGNEALVSTSRVRVRAALADCRASAGAVVAGAVVSLRVPKELPELSPGFLSVMGDAADDDASAAGVVRVYWHIGRDRAADLVRLLTTGLNERAVPFRLKIVDHPLRLDRCDAAVVYVPVGRFAEVRGLLEHAASALADGLRPWTPIFTRELAPGVGAAEDADVGTSFGERRCGLLADAIVGAHERGIVGTEPRLRAVEAQFDEHGVRLDAPYLDPSFDGRHVL